jgi:endoglucanase
MEYGNNNSYNATNGLFVWGSNYLTANQGIILAMAYDFTGEQKYLQMAVEQLNYLLGKNSLDMCFVSGFGYNSPKSQHNRLAIAKNTLMTGAMSGGPDASREDNITKALPDIAPAKIYADDWRSYSTNEIAIYYNSALLYLMTAVY